MDTTTQQARQGIAVMDWVIIAVMAVVLFALDFILTEFQIILVSDMLIVALFSLSLNLIMGYGGMVHFGHAAFYGLGGYAYGIGVRELGIDPVLAMILAPLFSTLAAVVVGWFCVRRVRLYFAILTLAFGQLFYTLVFQMRHITGGDDGLHGLDVPAFLDDTTNFYLFLVVMFILCYSLLRMIVRSPFVTTLKAIRENPERAQFIGINVRRHQLITFVIGGFFAGIAGMLLAVKQHFVGVEMLFWTTSAEPILGSLLGGMFSLPGPAIGGALLVFLNFFLTRITEYWPLVLGTLTVIMVLVAPAGIVGLFQQITGRESREA